MACLANAKARGNATQAPHIVRAAVALIAELPEHLAERLPDPGGRRLLLDLVDQHRGQGYQR